ncbi:MAG: hypothetical protein KF729_36830 [Sandaracinaceae bacterium]|nr:hypothetical protein [Sandaracinaceae bacterium]
MRRAALVATIALATALGAAGGAEDREPAVGSDGAAVRGVALGLFATDPEWDYGPMLRELRARGASDVLLVVQLSQRDRFSSDLVMRPGHAPSEAALTRTIRDARARGLRVGLMPIVHLLERRAEEWRGQLTPADGLDTWFARYGELVLGLAALAEREGVTRLVVGSELSSLEPYDARWRALVAAVRLRFSGALAYSANWDRLDDVRFWDALDEIGLTAYFPLSHGDEAPSAAALARAWERPRARIAALARRHGRPVVLTEVGYPSRRGAARAPWDDGPPADRASIVDLEQQRVLYDAFCEAFAGRGVIDGFYAWNWFGVGGPRDTSFTLRGKPAARALEACFARAWSAAPERVRSAEDRP